MIKDGNVVCDLTSIILEDKVCLLPGYIEVREGRIIEHTTHDPENSNQRPGVLKNRIAYRDETDRGAAHEKTAKMHFINLEAYHEYLKKIDTP